MRGGTPETAFIGAVNGEAPRKENRIWHRGLIVFVREMVRVHALHSEHANGVSNPERPLDTLHMSVLPSGFFTAMRCRPRSTKISTFANAGAPRPQRTKETTKARNRVFDMTQTKYPSQRNVYRGPPITDATSHPRLRLRRDSSPNYGLVK